MLSPSGTAVEDLNSLLRHTKMPNAPAAKKQTTTSQASQSSLLKKMSKGASKLLANKDSGSSNMLQMSSDHLINLHNSAEQLV